MSGADFRVLFFEEYLFEKSYISSFLNYFSETELLKKTFRSKIVIFWKKSVYEDSFWTFWEVIDCQEKIPPVSFKRKLAVSKTGF